jgi:hypothetical protein
LARASRSATAARRHGVAAKKMTGEGENDGKINENQ